MNKQKYFFRGVGVALIIAASIFYFVGLSNKESASTTIRELDDSEIISRAKELGMVKEDQIVKEKEDLTDDDIIEKARKLGMVFVEEIEKSDDDTNQDKSVADTDNTENMSTQDTNNEDDQESIEEKDTNNEESDDTTSDSSSEETKDSESETVTLKITYGMASDDVAKLLYDNGVVDSIREFDRYLIIHKYDQKIKTGSYVFNLKSTYEEAMKIFTNKK